MMILLMKESGFTLLHNRVLNKTLHLGIGVGNWKIESMKYDAKYAIGIECLFMLTMIFFKLHLNQEFLL